MQGRYAILAALLLAGCGTYHKDVVYEATPPAPAGGTISPSKKAVVFAKLSKPRSRASLVLHFEVMIEGYSRFRLMDNEVTLRRTIDGKLVENRVPLQPFELSSGTAKVAARMVPPDEEFAGPGSGHYKLYYATQPYASIQWMFSSETPLAIADAEELAVVLPRAVIDGEALDLPVVHFKRKVVVWREAFNLK
jgi:hypothetical protein